GRVPAEALRVEPAQGRRREGAHRGGRLTGGGALARVQDAVLHRPALDHLIVADDRAFDHGALYPDVSPQNAVGYGAAGDAAPRAERHVGADGGVHEPYAVFDVDRIPDDHALGRRLGTSRPAGLEQVTVRLEQRIDFPAVVPATDFSDHELLAAVHHVLERIGQVELAALPRRAALHLRDAVEQRLPVLDVVEPDVGELRDRRARFLHDA